MQTTLFKSVGYFYRLFSLMLFSLNFSAIHFSAGKKKPETFFFDRDKTARKTVQVLPVTSRLANSNNPECRLTKIRVKYFVIRRFCISCVRGCNEIFILCLQFVMKLTLTDGRHDYPPCGKLNRAIQESRNESQIYQRRPYS